MTFSGGNIISASSGAHGFVTPTGSVIVNHGDDQSLSFTPDPGYYVGDVVVDGVSLGTMDGYTFTDVQSAHTLSVSFVESVITVMVDGEGMISPSNSVVTVAAGANQSFAFSPALPGTVEAVFVDNVSLGPITSHQFQTISSDHWMYAFFRQNTYNITSSASDGGTINPQGTVLVSGGIEQVFTLIPAAGFAMGAVSGTCGGILDTQAQTFTISVASQDCSVQALFVPDSPADNHFVVTPSVSTVGGTLEPAVSQTVTEGGVATFTISPDPGYISGPVTGSCGGTTNAQTETFTTFPVSQDYTVETSFVADEGVK